MQTLKYKQTFSTDNFPLAIFLKAKMCNLLHIEKNNPRHAVFVFTNSPEREKLTIDFWQGKALVEPRLFFSCQKDLKMILYDDSYQIQE